MKLWFRFLFIFITALLFVSACQNKAEQNPVITIGTSPGPYSQLFIDAVKPILEKQGYTIKQIDFSDLMLADIALQEGRIDLNVDQHSAYLNAFNKNKNGQLIALTHIPTVPTAIYSIRHSNLAAIAKNSKIAIPNDPANTARAYRLLAKAGWIKLKENDSDIYSKNDITQNPYQLDIKEMDSSNIPRTLMDFDYSVVPGSRAYAAKLNPKLSLLQEDVIPAFELVVAIKNTNIDKPWVKAVEAAYRSEEFKQYMQNHNVNNYWYMPED